jgi:hypothetical protein
VLDGLRITTIGHQACVTAGIELLERIDTGLEELIRPLQKKLKSGPLPPLGQLDPEPLDEHDQKRYRRRERDE